jgi:hypothetical protein
MTGAVRLGVGGEDLVLLLVLVGGAGVVGGCDRVDVDVDARAEVEPSGGTDADRLEGTGVAPGEDELADPDAPGRRGAGADELHPVTAATRRTATHADLGRKGIRTQ